MTDFCFSAFMGYDILKKLGGDTMATILMIDDERPILELVKNGLQKDGHLVTVYTSAAQVPPLSPKIRGGQNGCLRYHHR